jgi:hypothetical protein
VPYSSSSVAAAAAAAAGSTCLFKRVYAYALKSLNSADVPLNPYVALMPNVVKQSYIALMMPNTRLPQLHTLQLSCCIHCNLAVAVVHSAADA